MAVEPTEIVPDAFEVEEEAEPVTVEDEVLPVALEVEDEEVATLEAVEDEAPDV